MPGSRDIRPDSLQTRGPIRMKGLETQIIFSLFFIILCQNTYPNNVNRGTALRWIIKRTHAEYELCRVPGSWADRNWETPGIIISHLAALIQSFILLERLYGYIGYLYSEIRKGGYRSQKGLRTIGILNLWLLTHLIPCLCSEQSMSTLCHMNNMRADNIVHIL